MSPTVFRLVLLVSSAHALVHLYELSLPSVEQNIGAEFEVGRETTGRLGSTWRIPWGIGAFFAGWLADRFGSKPMLVIYLLGCAMTCVAAWGTPNLDALFVVMFLMGTYASIYHPAGLALISREAPVEFRSKALGWHGIFGSLGIAAAPFLAWLFLSMGSTWRDYYLILAVPGAILAFALMQMLRENRDWHKPTSLKPVDEGGARDRFQPIPYAVLMGNVLLSGIVYSGFMHFLPRYLTEAGMRPSWVENDVTFGKLAAAIVLVVGVFGQATAGKIARPNRLAPLLGTIMALNAPCLFWMAVAEGPQRLIAACLLGYVHFMSQPVYNSLVAHFVPSRRRSLGFGFSNMFGFGFGGTGAAIAGELETFGRIYTTLAFVALGAAALAFMIPRLDRSAKT
jgi:MFS transporter, FSR family, fosmidomycin resistance protein